MTESKIFNEWTSKARLEGMAESMLGTLEGRFGAAALSLAKKIRACTDVEQMRRWALLAGKSASLEDFRHDTGL